MIWFEDHIKIYAVFYQLNLKGVFQVGVDIESILKENLALNLEKKRNQDRNIAKREEQIKEKDKKKESNEIL